MFKWSVGSCLCYLILLLVSFPVHFKWVMHVTYGRTRHPATLHEDIWNQIGTRDVLPMIVITADGRILPYERADASNGRHLSQHRQLTNGQTSTGAGYTDAWTGKTILRVDWSQCKTSLATSLCVCVAFIMGCFCAAPSVAASSDTWFLFIYFLRRSFRFQ